LFQAGCFEPVVDDVPADPGCTNLSGFAPSETLCLTDRECTAGLCQDGDVEAGVCGRCVPNACSADADCRSPRDACDTRRAVCVADSCADVAACAVGSTCVNTVDGALCERAPALGRCDLTPTRGVWVDGVAATLDVAGEDALGAPAALAADATGVFFEATGQGAAIDGELIGSNVVTGIAIVPHCDAGRCRASAQVEASGTTCEAELVVLAPRAQEAVRVIVIHDADEAPIAGAAVTIALDDGSVLELTSDQDGVVESGALGVAVPSAITVRANTYAVLTLLMPTERDVVVPLAKARSSALIAGVTGSIDATNVIAPADIIVGAAGAPFANLEDALRAERLFGRPRVSFLDLGSAEPAPFVSFTAGTLAVGTQVVEEKFAAESEPGRGFAWAFVGATGLAEISEMLGNASERGPLYPAIELVRAMDERATFGLSRVVSSTWVGRPERNADLVDAGLTDVGMVVPDVFTGARVELVVPPLPPGHDGALLLALADSPGGAVVLGARYLEDGDEDGFFDDDLRPIASGHDLFYAPPSRALFERPLTFAIVAIDRLSLEDGVLGEARVFHTQAAMPDPSMPLAIADAFLSPPIVSFNEEGLLAAADVADELRLTFALPTDAGDSFERLHTFVLTTDAQVSLPSIEPAVLDAELVSARATRVQPDWRAGARAARARVQHAHATAAFDVLAP
jgi:hypothetical protein